MKRKTLPHNPKYPLKSFRVIDADNVWDYLESLAQSAGLTMVADNVNREIYVVPRSSYFAKKDGEK